MKLCRLLLVLGIWSDEVKNECSPVCYSKISISTPIMMRHHQQVCGHVCKTANLVSCPHPGPHPASLHLQYACRTASNREAGGGPEQCYFIAWFVQIMQTWCSSENVQETYSSYVVHLLFCPVKMLLRTHSFSSHPFLCSWSIKAQFLWTSWSYMILLLTPQFLQTGWIHYTEGNLNIIMLNNVTWLW